MSAPHMFQMRGTSIPAALQLMVLAGACVPGVSARAQDPKPAYSTAQAKQGEVIFTEKCGKCHTATGDGMGPALKGDAFWTIWEGKQARLLYRRILSTMPADDPGSLTDKETIRVVSYILQMNELPGGTVDIDTADGLNSITIARPK